MLDLSCEFLIAFKECEERQKVLLVEMKSEIAEAMLFPQKEEKDKKKGGKKTKKSKEKSK